MNKREMDDRLDEGKGWTGKALALLIGKNKKKRKAIETTCKYFHEFGKKLSEQESSSANIGRDISIITSVKRIIDYVLGLFLVFIIVFANFMVMPGQGVLDLPKSFFGGWGQFAVRKIVNKPFKLYLCFSCIRRITVVRLHQAVIDGCNLQLRIICHFMSGIENQEILILRLCLKQIFK